MDIKLESVLKYIEASQEINLSDSGSQESSKFDFGDFFQLMVCKYLLKDNQKMRAQLGMQAGPIKEKFEGQLLSRLNKKLNQASI